MNKTKRVMVMMNKKKKNDEKSGVGGNGRR